MHLFDILDAAIFLLPVAIGVALASRFTWRAMHHSA